jgi:two-component system response regulator HydG
MQPLKDEPLQRFAVPPKRVRLLTVTDDPSTLELTMRLAHGLGFDVVPCSGAHEALQSARGLRPDAVFVDLQRPAAAAIELLRAIREVESSCAVILTTARSDVDSAMQAVKLGALDCVTRPIDAERLRDPLTTVVKGIERRELLLTQDAQTARRFEFHGMIGRSAAMQDLFDSFRRLAPYVRAALIAGEAGTGRELAARAIHHLGSQYDRRFMVMDCSGGRDEIVVESELFGHQRGSFAGAIETRVGAFEQADGGTLFLNEIGGLPPGVQTKLLRAMETGEATRIGAADGQRFEVRVLAATSRDLRAAVAVGRMRRDLFERLRGIQFALPPLRARRDDIPLLAATFVEEFASTNSYGASGITTGAERLLQHAAWERNVRELREVIERACSMGEGRLLGDREIRAAMAAVSGDPVEKRFGETRDADDPDLLSNAQRRQIERVLKRVGGNKTEAARLLGISRRALYRWLERLKLTPRR